MLKVYFLMTKRSIQTVLFNLQSAKEEIKHKGKKIVKKKEKKLTQI